MKTRIQFLPSRKRHTAFTRADVLAFLCALGLIAFIALPALANDRYRSKTIGCLANLRELSLGWLAYPDDNEGNLVVNISGRETYPTFSPGWVTGWLDWSNSNENTNLLFLLDPRYARLAPYIRTNAAIFKCPEDQFASPTQVRSGHQRVRSYSMNYAMGPGDSLKSSFAPNWAVFQKLSDITQLKPSEALVFLEEHPDSINDPVFVFDPNNVRWLDLPGGLHQGSGGLSFADGHVELHQWLDSTTLQPVKFTQFSTPQISRSPDYQWVKARLSVPKFAQ